MREFYLENEKLNQKYDLISADLIVSCLSSIVTLLVFAFLFRFLLLFAD